MSQSVVLNGATSGEVRISADGSRIYNAGPDGVLRVFDTLTGALLHEWQIGGSPGAMDMSPDGGLLVIVDRTQPIITYVDLLRFGAVTTAQYVPGPNQGLIVDVAIMADQTAVIIQEQTGGRIPALRRLNLNTLEMQSVDTVGPNSVLSRAIVQPGGYSEVLVSQPLGEFGVYRSFGSFQSAFTNNDSPVPQAISASLVAIVEMQDMVGIYDSGLNALTVLSGFDFGTVRELAFSAEGQFLYVLGQNGGRLFTMRTSDWSLANTFDTGLQIAEGNNVPVTMLVDPRGQFFTIQTEAGFVVVENPLAPVLEGTMFPDQITGTLFGDVIAGLGGDDTINAGDGADVIRAGAGFNVVDGGSNVDTLVISGNSAAYTITQISTGRFEISDGVNPGLGGSFDDLINVEFVQFDDRTIRLRPGTGVSVNFETANPAVYQSAMNAIRDFDGNALGGNGSWLRIGSADVNGDGDIDQILVNRAIGRFATVGTAPDGLVYFSDFSWAGETRVAGIYIDPLVAAGIVEAFGPNDSQRRFQNDLQIENINRVLGANDYDRDGLQEVYLALTDGTAYLRAIMEFDGNIRYANYQSQQEVIDYLAANGFGQETWGTWFNHPSEGEVSLMQGDLMQANLMQERIDMVEASGLGRAALTGFENVMAGTINPATLAFHAPALDDHMRAEFYG